MNDKATWCTMNERDIQLVRAIDPEIQFDGSPSIYLLSAKYTNLVRVNLVLLKDFLDEKRKKGVIVTIDRPHQYISHLLQLHGIDQTNLTYIDAISTHSSDTKGGAVASEFQHGPFHIESLPDFMFSGEDTRRAGMLDLSGADFVVIDNVSTLLTYNTMESIRKFFSKYVDLIGKSNCRSVTTALVMDKDIYVDLFGFVLGLSKKVIDVSQDMTIRQVTGPGQPTSPIPVITPPAKITVQPELGILKNKDVM